MTRAALFFQQVLMRFLFVLLLSLCLTACTANANLQTDLDQGLAGNNGLSDSSLNSAGFQVWANDFTQRALTAGYDPVATRRVMSSVHFQPKIIPLDQKQPETQLTLQQYLDKTVSADRIQKGRSKYAENITILQQIEQQTGVPANILVALWGKETSYGAVTGGYAIGDALATMAYEGRRRAFFEKELVAFIQVTQQVARDPIELQGSWAGAMGQCQFMPSSYLKYAVDGDGDQIADIWTSLPDVFASSANFLKQNGWRAGQPVAIPVTLPETLNPVIIGRDKTPYRVRDWLQQGVTISSKYAANDYLDLPTRIYAPDGNAGPAFIIFPNFDAIMRWNSSGYFVTGVATLAQRIAGNVE